MLYYYCCLYDFDAGKSITRALEGVGPEYRDQFGPWNGNESSKLPFEPKKAFTKQPITKQLIVQNNLENNSDT